MTRTLASTPAADGFRMPGEFESHAGCWMLWPERPDNWRLGAKPAQAAFAAVAAAISTSEPVSVGVSAAQFLNARARLPRNVRVVEITSNDASKLAVGQIQYSSLPTPQGTVVDDVLVYRWAPEHFLLVINAGNIDKDVACVVGMHSEEGQRQFRPT